jgi:phage tail sheath protein FI
LRASIAATENAALFFPYLNLVGNEGPAPGEEQVLTVAPSGSVAGLMARLDDWSGVWTAPAGPAASLNAVTDLSTHLTDQQTDALNRLGVNCLRGFSGKGNLVWGSRTLQGAADLASEWKYIQVRRLALFIEESIRRNIGWVAFEPNDAQLWSALREEIGSFLQDLFSKGAFQGLAAQDGYFVKCDASTTTQSDIDAGEVNVVIGFAPLKPAEFVIISLTQIADTCA